MMNSNIDAISLNDLFLISWNMTSVFHTKGIHEKYCLGPLLVSHQSPLLNMSVLPETYVLLPFVEKV